MAGVLTPGRHRKCMSRIRSRNTKPSVRNEHLNGALFTLNHLFLENLQYVMRFRMERAAGN